MDILIIEDDLMLRRAMSHYLLEKGNAVRVAGNGKEAISVIEKGPEVDLIICDVLMPELSGPSFLLMLKRHFPGGMPAIIVMSTLKDGEQFVKKLSIPCDAFLSKPVDFGKLDELISNLSLREGQKAAG